MPQIITIYPGTTAPVTSETELHDCWPLCDEGPPERRENGAAAALNPANFLAIHAKAQFGAPTRYAQYNVPPHNATTSYAMVPGDNTRLSVLKDAACWNWALTGGTVTHPNHDAWMRPDELIDLNYRTHANPLGLLTTAQYLSNEATPGLQACYEINQAAIDAWQAMPQGSDPSRKAKMTAFVRIMCAIKGLTVLPPLLPGGGANHNYAVCCAYTLGVVNWDHWGLELRNNAGVCCSLQTVNGHGIWKSGSFALEWGPPLYLGDDVVVVPVGDLTPTHRSTIQAIIAYNP
jgi:hypothetical protein